MKQEEDAGREPGKPSEAPEYHNARMQREVILQKLKDRGFRITKQRRVLLDIILERDCASCKEIFYQASKVDAGIGTATVYRMVNILEEIGAISRKNMYKVLYSEHCPLENQCEVRLEDGTVYQLSAQKWNAVGQAGLQACGYLDGQRVASITVKACGCGPWE